MQRRRVLGLPPPSSTNPSPSPGPGPGPSPSPSPSRGAAKDPSLLEQGLAAGDSNNIDDDADAYDDDDDDDDDREDVLSYRELYGEQVEVFTVDYPGRPLPSQPSRGSKGRQGQWVAGGQGAGVGQVEVGFVGGAGGGGRGGGGGVMGVGVRGGMGVRGRHKDKGSGKEDEEEPLSMNPWTNPHTNPRNAGIPSSHYDEDDNDDDDDDDDDDDNDLRFADIYDPSREGAEVGVVKMNVNERYTRLKALADATAGGGRGAGMREGERGMREGERGMRTLSLSIPPHQSLPLPLPPAPTSTTSLAPTSTTPSAAPSSPVSPASPTSVVLSFADVYQHSGGTEGDHDDDVYGGIGVYEENEVYRR